MGFRNEGVEGRSEEEREGEEQGGCRRHMGSQGLR